MADAGEGGSVARVPGQRQVELSRLWDLWKPLRDGAWSKGVASRLPKAPHLSFWE